MSTETSKSAPFDSSILSAEVQERIRKTHDQRLETRRAVAMRDPLSAEKNLVRRSKFIKRIKPPSPDSGAEAIQGETIDYIDAVFLPIGARAARTVARALVDRGHTPKGSGFMISPRLFITNNHVLIDAEAAAGAWIDFNYELDETGAPAAEIIFELDPEAFFHTVSWELLDYSVVAVGKRVRGTGELSDQGFCPLCDCGHKHAIGMPVNIIQHPLGREKKLVVRQNRLVARYEHVLHYEADTEKGSSGSPVLNDAWEVIALHHWGEPHLETRSVDGVDSPVTVNEGVRISAIVDDLNEHLKSLTDRDGRAMLQEALDLGEEGRLAEPMIPARAKAPREEEAPRPVLANEGNKSNDLGSGDAPDEAVFIVPLEVRVRILTPRGHGAARQSIPKPESKPSEHQGLAEAGPEALRIDRNYDNRRGYDPKFLPDLDLPILDLLPQPMRSDVAPIIGNDAELTGALPYEHFSVVLHAERRFAILTATNIDGETYIKIDRRTGLPKAEAAESWYDDPRMFTQFYVGEAFYATNSKLFDRGHLTRREDVNWGAKERAIRANADTYHRTNCAPQQWRFNETLTYWQGIEQHYLEYGAALDKSRLIVLQGPVFGKNDPFYDDGEGGRIQVPLQFWKIVVRVENHTPKATGFLASQEGLLSEPRRGAEAAPEVGEYLASLDLIGKLTKLDLRKLAQYDTYTAPSGEVIAGAESMGGELKPIRSWQDLDLS